MSIKLESSGVDFMHEDIWYPCLPTFSWFHVICLFLLNRRVEKPKQGIYNSI